MKFFTATAIAALALYTGLGLFAVRATAADEKGWSTIKGQIVWGGGEIPPRQPVNVDNAQAHCLSKGPILSEDWVINPKNKGVQWTIVWLAPEPGQKKLPIHPSLKAIKDKTVVIDQPCCTFIPHVVAMREGQDLEVKNSAPDVPHNVNWTGHPLKNPGGNVLIPAGKSFTIQGLKADRLPLIVKCNIHSWMGARVAVLDHPYFAVTDENGSFVIPKAPAGNYRVKIYHESIGWLGGAKGRDGYPYKINDGGVTDLGKIELKPNK